MYFLVEEVTAADDRRRSQSHLSNFLSLEEMRERERERGGGEPDVLKEQKLHPSTDKATLCPKNPFNLVIIAFRSKLQVQYQQKIKQTDEAVVSSQYTLL